MPVDESVHWSVAAAFLAFSAGSVALWFALQILARRYRARFRQSVGLEMQRAFLFVDTGRLLALNLGALTIGAVAVLWFTGNPYLVLVWAVLCAGLPRIALRWMRRRRMQAFREQMPEILSLLAGSLRAGAGLSSAMADLADQLQAPARQELAMVLREQRMGSTLDRALAGLERRMPFDDTVLMVSALRLGLRAGGGMAATLDTLAEAMRTRLTLEGKIRALTAQGRLQAWVMGLLPLAVLAATLLIDPGLADLYFRTLAGWAVLAGVAVLQAIGALWISRLVAIEV